jgi:hypothetical protein
MQKHLPCRLNERHRKRGFVVFWLIDVQEEIRRPVKRGDLVKLDIPSGDPR